MDPGMNLKYLGGTIPGWRQMGPTGQSLTKGRHLQGNTSTGAPHSYSNCLFLIHNTCDTLLP